MREIKFRAWDKIKEEFELLDSFYEIQKMNLSNKELMHKEFSQFTGLKDKNGKEIYEGDIVTQHLLRTTSFKEINSEIIYYEGGFAIATLSDDGKDKFISRLEKGIESEVIGNIYESPDLLNN